MRQTILVVTVLAACCVAFSGRVHGAEPDDDAYQPHTPTLIFHLTGANRPEDEEAIRATVQKLPSLRKCVVNTARGYVQVRFDSHVVSYHQVAQAIADAGTARGKTFDPRLPILVPEYAQNAAKVDEVFAGKRLNQRVRIEPVDKAKGEFVIHFLHLEIDPSETGPQGFNGGHLNHPMHDPPPRGLGLKFTYASEAPPAEPTVVPLWPGKAPQDVGIEGEEYVKIFESPILKGPTRLITNVTKPSISVYLPPKEQNTGTAMIVCPGGGYHNLFWELEGEEVVAWLNARGMTGIILKYRCPRRPGEVKTEPPLGPQLDAQRAVSLVRSRASEWGIDPARIGMVGFSAGGHLTLATATNFEKRLYEPVDVIDQVSCRPDFAVCCYSGYLKAKEQDAASPTLRFPEKTPPVFFAHSSDDKISNSEHSVFAYVALKRAGIPTELHIYATGDHDFGVRQNGQLPETWTDLCLKWLRSNGLLK
jgi:acetyl esterase/lipase